MSRFNLAVAIGILSIAIIAAPFTALGENDGGWVQLFNGKDLTGWKTHPNNPGEWRVENGTIVSHGWKVSHLFTVRNDYQDFQFRIEAKISDKGNSGQLFRAKFASDYPPGYEAQINSNFPTDPVRTGSLYPAFDPTLTAEKQAKIIVTAELVKPDEWFTQEVIARGNHIVIKLNGKTTVDFVDEKNTFTKGSLALQQHGAWGGNPETVLHVRKFEIKELKSTNANE